MTSSTRVLMIEDRSAHIAALREELATAFVDVDRGDSQVFACFHAPPNTSAVPARVQLAAVWKQPGICLLTSRCAPTRGRVPGSRILTTRPLVDGSTDNEAGNEAPLSDHVAEGAPEVR